MLQGFGEKCDNVSGGGAGPLTTEDQWEVIR